ncbi:hypothetical protein J432_0742 [Campylobacter jejuni subsp. jejuni HN-CJD07035]|nr:conserved domain protein [Campylobacter jejuni RM1221]ALF92025.1 hypothetical protein CjjRM3197_1008 [Campylobacter jejuni subsp. jejuni]ALF93661.1 hypothetical protein CjjRM3196_1008 [Campylobacter jejuni subsp. jejuni]ENI11962.1 hypothetical protein H840_0231 [Campylobacter jejuni subsp. jejuni ICDCCJ07002]EPS03572.1 hypothetical protein J432_0742 [Campylobacter jejuni subsp. jejuni HN-CJD07035]
MLLFENLYISLKIKKLKYKIKKTRKSFLKYLNDIFQNLVLKRKNMEFLAFIFLIIIFLFVVFIIVTRYEKKIKLLNQNIQNMKEDIADLKETTQKNRSLIEKNRSNIENIIK